MTESTKLLGLTAMSKVLFSLRFTNKTHMFVFNNIYMFKIGIILYLWENILTLQHCMFCCLNLWTYWYKKTILDNQHCIAAIHIHIRLNTKLFLHFKPMMQNQWYHSCATYHNIFDIHVAIIFHCHYSLPVRYFMHF